MMHSVRWLSLAQASKVLGQLVSVVVLSRLLPPSAYGVMALAGVVLTFASLLRDMGTGAAIIQRKSLTPALANTVFWLNAGMGVSLGLVLAAAAYPISIFFREPQLFPVMLLMSLGFPLGAITAVHQAWMERHARFRELAILDVFTQVGGLCLSVACALAGWGVYSFVVPTLFTIGVNSTWLWFKSGFKPGRSWSREEFRSLWGFSGSLTAFNFINYFARNADSMIIGRLLGAGPLGQYGMAYKLMLFPVQHMSWVVGRALLPRLSGIQDDLGAVRDVYFKVLGGIALLSMPIMVGLWSLRVPFTEVVLGPTWAIVAPLLGWLAPVGIMQSLMSTIGSTLTSQGRTAALFYLGLFNTATVLLGFFLGAQHGVVGVAAGYFVANSVNFIVTLVCMGRWLQATPGPLWRQMKAPVLSSLAMGLALYAAGLALGHTELPLKLQLGMLIAVGAAVYLGVLGLFGLSPKTLLSTLKGKA
ncbi:lipopolysaccharide biosynthesis protein [Roseateles sp. SL47]|uniref:lipopolysaccharide biosynthesis protein n=1 Tax=Roseateles sp. SL47 TaxID=2995138 RepID=UPI0022710C08|nr:lipopolysaccharide biosynthesis protein [Roseateles sp. SL47]WAC75153.1 lipopolysaccharide biosynthesis protein [Roseateles sp. SL47]